MGRRLDEGVKLVRESRVLVGGSEPAVAATGAGSGGFDDEGALPGDERR
jgi:hypothetical protein